MIRLLMIGAGVAGETVLREILLREELRSQYQVCGFLDDDPDKHEVCGVPVLGRIADAEQVLRKVAVDEILIAIPSLSQDKLEAIFDDLAPMRTRIKRLPQLKDLLDGKVSYREAKAFDIEDLLGREEVGFDIDQMMPFYKDQTVLVTGGGGSIGSEIVRQLLSLSVKGVVVLDHSEYSLYRLGSELAHDPRLTCCVGGVHHCTKLRRLVREHGITMVFHVAAYKHVSLMELHPEEALWNNVYGTYCVLQVMAQENISHFVFVSTDKAVNPSSVMGASKHMAERVVLSMGYLYPHMRCALTRFGNVLGASGSVIPRFRQQIAKGGPVTVTHPDMERFFMSIREAVCLVLKVVTLDEGDIFVLDMGDSVKILDLAKRLIHFCGYRLDEIPIVFTGRRNGEKLTEEVLTDDEALSQTMYKKLLVLNRAQALWSLEQMEELMQYIKNCAEEKDLSALEIIQKYVPEYDPT